LSLYLYGTIYCIGSNALQLAEALEAARKASPTGLKSKAAARAAASLDAASPYISPYNIRVTAGGSRAPTNGLKMITEDMLRASVHSDDEDSNASGETEAEDEEKDVLNRSELKKMSQKLLRFRKKLEHVPGVSTGLPQSPATAKPFEEAAHASSRAQMLRSLSRSSVKRR
jgi:hypothetical protein